MELVHGPAKAAEAVSRKRVAASPSDLGLRMARAPFLLDTEIKDGAVESNISRPRRDFRASNWWSARSCLCNCDAGDREQPTDNQLRGHAVAKEQHARNQGEHGKQQAEG